MLIDFTASHRNRIRSQLAFEDVALAIEIEFEHPDNPHAIQIGRITAMLDHNDEPTWDVRRATHLAGYIEEGPDAGCVFFEPISETDLAYLPQPH